MNSTTTWDFEWPEWVPESVRKEIERSWSYYSRSVEQWKESARNNGAPEFGSIQSLLKLGPSDEQCVPGKFVYCWGNIGRVAHEDGSFDYVSFHRDNDILSYQG